MQTALSGREGDGIPVTLRRSTQSVCEKAEYLTATAMVHSDPFPKAISQQPVEFVKRMTP